MFTGGRPVATGADLRAMRATAGLSLGRMAQRTHFAKSYLSMIENDKRSISTDVVAAYEQVLGVSVSLPGDPLRVAHEWLVSDPPTVEWTRSGRQIGASLASELESRVVRLRHLDDTVSSTELGPVIVRELQEVESLAHSASFTEPVGRRLLTVVGELCQLAGWVASDAGQHARAQRYYLTGVTAANEAQDRVLGAQLLSSLSYQLANHGNPADAALLARTAAVGALGATPLVRALFQERVAWASAKAGNTCDTWQALDEVDGFYSERSADEPHWVYWLNKAEVDVMAGRCLIELGQPVKAEPLLSAAIASYPPEHAREIALYLSWLAEAYARAGDLDAAEDTLRRARAFDELMPSTRTVDRLAAVEALIAQRRRGNGMSGG